MFLEHLNKFPNNDKNFFYFDDYIIELSQNDIRFGIARSGHSGGFWFIPTMTETDDKIIFSGEIQHINSYSNEKGFKKIINKIDEYLLLVLLLPFFLIIKLYYFFSSIIKKILKHSKSNEETLEDRLYNLMENHLNCIRL